MSENLTRRDLLKFAALFAAAVKFSPLEASDLVPNPVTAATPPGMGPSTATPATGGAQNAYAHDGSSNFKAIYGDPTLKAAFFLFLQNVFNLYPEDDFHALIDKVSLTAGSDREIYEHVQAQLPNVKPLLSEVRYALPALRKQKEEMVRQTLDLLGGNRRVNGFMELGSTGRYAGALRHNAELTGDIVLMHTDPPSYSPVDIVERGGLFKFGRFVPLNDYAPVSRDHVADASLDLVGNFIGFHHAALDRLDAFVASIHRVLRPGGRLILRDHDASSVGMNRMVALAHDVFNLGINADWSVNQQEVRHFTSLEWQIPYLRRMGFRKTTKTLLQAGDPTRNALMEFVKV